MAYGSTNPDPVDEDFKKRYATETAGMPADLALVASRNLAAQDASIERVNAAARLSPSPVPGTAYATPTTDISNLDTASAMDRFSSPTAPTLADTHVDDIATRRDAIDSQKKEIMAKLGIIPPQDAGFSAVVLAAPQERQRLLQDWHVLETQSQNLLREHHYSAIEQAKLAHENFARENHIAASKDFADLADTLLQIRKNPNLKEGTPEYGQAILQAAKDHSAGFQTQAGQTLVRGMSASHDKTADLEDRSYYHRFDQAFKEASEVAKKRGVEVQYDAQGFPSIALTSQLVGVQGPSVVSSDDVAKQLQQLHKITPNELLNPVSVKRGKIGKDDKFTSDYSEAATGPAVQIDTGSRSVTMSNSEYDRYKSALEPKANQITSQQEYDALPAGSDFVWKGKRGKKPAAQ